MDDHEKYMDGLEDEIRGVQSGTFLHLAYSDFSKNNHKGALSKLFSSLKYFLRRNNFEDEEIDYIMEVIDLIEEAPDSILSNSGKINSDEKEEYVLILRKLVDIESEFVVEVNNVLDKLKSIS